VKVEQNITDGNLDMCVIFIINYFLLRGDVPVDSEMF
jgi:hypothetical protein